MRIWTTVRQISPGAAPWWPAVSVTAFQRHGIPAPYKIRIPMFGDCDSLNVGVATTLMLYEASLQLKGLIHSR